MGLLRKKELYLADVKALVARDGFPLHTNTSNCMLEACIHYVSSILGLEVFVELHETYTLKLGSLTIQALVHWTQKVFNAAITSAFLSERICNVLLCNIEEKGYARQAGILADRLYNKGLVSVYGSYSALNKSFDNEGPPEGMQVGWKDIELMLKLNDNHSCCTYNGIMAVLSPTVLVCQNCLLLQQLDVQSGSRLIITCKDVYSTSVMYSIGVAFARTRPMLLPCRGSVPLWATAWAQCAEAAAFASLDVNLWLTSALVSLDVRRASTQEPLDDFSHIQYGTFRNLFDVQGLRDECCSLGVASGVVEFVEFMCMELSVDSVCIGLLYASLDRKVLTNTKLSREFHLCCLLADGRYMHLLAVEELSDEDVFWSGSHLLRSEACACLTDQPGLLERRGEGIGFCLSPLLQNGTWYSLSEEVHFALWDDLYEFSYVADATVVQYKWDGWFSNYYRDAEAEATYPAIRLEPEALVREAITEGRER